MPKTKEIRVVVEIKLAPVSQRQREAWAKFWAEVIREAKNSMKSEARHD